MRGRLLLPLALLAIACGDRSGPPSYTLSPSRQKSFEAWQAALIKTCDVDNAFGGTQAGDDGAIDAAVFFALTHHSLMIHHAQGDVYLDTPVGVAGDGESVLTESQTVEGARADFAVKMQLAGSHCSVFISGALAYETDLWAQLPVLAVVSTDPQRFTLEAPYAAPKRAIVQHGLIRVMTGDLQQGAAIQRVLAAALPELAARPQSHPTSPLPDGRHAFLLFDSYPMQHARALAIDSTHPEIDATDDTMQTLLAAQSSLGPIALDLVIRPPAYAHGNLRNDGDSAPWHLRAAVSWLSKDLANRDYAVESLAPGASIAAPSFDECVLERQTLGADDLYGAGAFAPAFDGLVGPCVTFSDDLGGDLAKATSVKDRISRMFAGLTGAPGRDYQGWDRALALIADSGATSEWAGVSSPLLAALDRNAVAVARGVAARPVLADIAGDLRDKLAVAWALGGQSVDDRALDRMLDALANVRPALPEAAGMWLDDLSRDPNHQGDEIAYALSITPAEKQRIAMLEAQADQISVRAILRDARLNRMIRERTPFVMLDTMSATIQALVDFHGREVGRAAQAPLVESDFGDAFAQVAQVAIGEGWAADDVGQVEAIAQVAAANPTCSLDRAVSSLVRCSGSTAFTRGDTGFLAPAFAGRYARLAPEILADLQALSLYSTQIEHQTLEQAFWGPIWRDCDTAGFDMRRQSVDRLASQAASTSDPSTLFDLENQLSLQVGPCIQGQ
jgi:hypothetical protein